MKDEARGSGKRRPDLGAIEGLASLADREWSLEMYRRYKTVRTFELQVRNAHRDRDISAFMYLCVGQEAIAVAPSMSLKGSYVLGQHRGHGIYLAFGGNPVSLVDELLGMPSGSNRGMGGSPPVQDFENRIIGHNGLIGDQVPVACGVAMSVQSGEKVVCYFGDGAAEEDYVLAALGHAGSRKLPILFICDDNDLSVLTPTADRRTWEITDVAESMGIRSVDIADDPWLVDFWCRELADSLPALINIRTCRELWHVGSGRDGPPEWDRWNLVRTQMESLQLAREMIAIDTEIETKMADLWRERLRIRSES
ncbi:MAG: thiamine pyrophosphate-dependent enzyme [Thalassobaculum sp.]|jgi:pyruvate dehydrogenase E1 component alpha subunit